MIRFSRLYDAIDRTTSTNAKVAAMAAYFAEAPPADAAWAVFFLTGRRLKRLLPYSSINTWTLAATGLPAWVLEECYAVVGDGAETAALVLDQLPTAPVEDLALSRWVEDRILPLKGLDPAAQQQRVTTWWRSLDRLQRFILLKLVTGELRVGVSQTLVVRALAEAAQLPAATLAARIMGEWTPSPEWYAALLSHERTDDDRSRPYPFFLASPLEGPVDALGDPNDWLVEWKWDGIRAQLVKRGGMLHLWSRGEELITHRFPEILAAASRLPDGTVLDGEVLAFRDERPLPFSSLQQRIGRQKQVAQLARTVPVVFMTYDILEDHGEDVRGLPQAERRAAAGGPAAAGNERDDGLTGSPAKAGHYDRLDRTSRGVRLQPDPGRTPPFPLVRAASWADLARVARRVALARSRGAHAQAPDVSLRCRTKARRLVEVEDRPLHDRRGADLRAARKRPPRQPPDRLHVRRLASGRARPDRQGVLGTLERGDSGNGSLDPAAHAGALRARPPRRARPRLRAADSKGSRDRRDTARAIAVRFPRMLRWRTDKKAEDADTLEAVQKLLEV